MKKRLIPCLLLLLSFSVLPANTPADNKELNCPLPAPLWLIATNVTPTSISLLWEQAQVSIYYKVEGYDLTGGFALPTYYVSNNTITYSGLTPGHLYKFDVSASNCPGGPFGPKISLEQFSGHIIIDVVLDLQSPCTPGTPAQTGPNQTYNFCVQESTSGEPYTNGFVGLFRYNSTNILQFGVASKDGVVYLGPMLLNGQNPNPSFLFPDNQSHPEYAECYFGDELVFRVDYDNYTTNANVGWTNLTIKFFGTYYGFRYCPAANLPCAVSEERGDALGNFEVDDHETPAQIVQTRLSPNPFTESATLQYELSEAGPVEINLYDATGQLVQAVEKTDSRDPGQYEAKVEGDDLPAGVYFLHLTTGQSHKTFALVKHD